MKDVTALVDSYKEAKKTYQDLNFKYAVATINRKFFKELFVDVSWEQSPTNIF